MKFTKHLPFILKSVAIATFFLAAFVFYDSFKIAKDFKNYVIMEKNSVDDAEFSTIAALFNGEVNREEISHFRKYKRDEIILQTANDSVANYYLSLILKGERKPTSIKRIRESVMGIYVNPFELETGHSYYFLYADDENDESKKIIYTHDGEANKEGESFDFHSTFVKVYSEHQLILHLDFDKQSHFSVKTYHDAERLNLVISLPSTPLTFTDMDTISYYNRNTESKVIQNKRKKDFEFKHVALDDVEISTKNKK